MEGIKHLIECRCVLSQFKRLKIPPRHQFLVFSIIDDEDEVKEKYVQCTNCGIIHKVFEIGKFLVVDKREHMSSIVTIDDIKQSIDERIASVLENNNADISTWEEAKFIIENEQWDKIIVLNRDANDDDVIIKVMRIISPSLFKIDTETRKEVFSDG